MGQWSGSEVKATFAKYGKYLSDSAAASLADTWTTNDYSLDYGNSLAESSTTSVFGRVTITDDGDAVFGGTTGATDPNLQDEQNRIVADMDNRLEQAGYMKTVAAQLGIPQELLDLWVQAWVDTGDQDVATAQVRENPKYDTYFPGNRRDNGTFRYSESQYNQLTENYAESLSSQGVNPDLFESQFKDLIEGNVSANEFRSRVTAISDRILNASPEALEAFGQRFGTNSASAALGVALNPQIGDAVLNRELTIAEVTGQSTRYGFNRGRSRVESLTNEGVGLEQARSFYSAAAESLPTLGGAGMRANEGGVGIGELEDVAFFGGSSKRLERIQQRERSLFSRSATTSNSDGALSGLRQR